MFSINIKTSKIHVPGELLHENTISSHVRRSPLLWLHNGAYQSKSKIVWNFTGVYVINRTLHGHLEIENFPSCVEKYVTCLLGSLVK